MQLRLRLIVITALLALAAMALPTAASASSDWGSATKWPWSGYWWPMYSGDATLYQNGGALQKYDTYVQNTTGTAGTAQAYEKAHYSTDDANNSWWGHCHAWAAASILTGEPSRSAVTKGGVTFSTDDQRGLITALYYNPKYAWLAGTRNNDDNQSSASYKDISPAWFDYLLRYYVGYYKYPFVMDIFPGAEVWNFPAFAYQRNVTSYSNGSQLVSTQVWYSDPTYGVTGTSYFSKVYTYVLQSGTLGYWTGSSVTDHPDDAWLPTGRNTVPDLNGSIVSQIVGENV